MAGKRDGWDVDEFEVFLIENPIKACRYEGINTSLFNMATHDVEIEAPVTEINDDDEVKSSNLQFELSNPKFVEREAIYEKELSEEKDSILDHSFLYKNLIKDVHLMDADELIEYKRMKYQEKKKAVKNEL